jgi:putative transcriptional regulator
MMKKYKSLQHTFLIAMPQIQTDCFSQAVIYVAEHNEHGAKGVIINKPLKSCLGDLLRHLDIPTKSKQINAHPLLMGGPVACDQAFLLQKKYDVDFQTGVIQLQIEVYSNKRELEALVKNRSLRDTLITIGHTRWKAGQLDEELKNNDWLIAPFNESVLFSVLQNKTPHDINAAIDHWYNAAANIGINMDYLLLDAGHA